MWDNQQIQLVSVNLNNAFMYKMHNENNIAAVALLKTERYGVIFIFLTDRVAEKLIDAHTIYTEYIFAQIHPYNEYHREYYCRYDRSGKAKYGRKSIGGTRLALHYQVC
jgi:hypothetical protein